jgi:hypothetical protein
MPSGGIQAANGDGHKRPVEAKKRKIIKPHHHLQYLMIAPEYFFDQAVFIRALYFYS